MISRYDAKMTANQIINKMLCQPACAFILTKGLSVMLSIVFLAISAATPVAPIIPVFAALLAGILNVGYKKFNLDLVRGNNPKALSVFDGFEYSMDSIYLELLKVVYIFLWSFTGILITVLGVIFFIFGVNALGIIFVLVGSVWTLFVSVIKSIQYSMAAWILSDNLGMHASTAIEKSKAITSGHIIDLLVFNITYFGWYLLTVLFPPCMLYVMPYYYTAMAYIYEEIKVSNETSASVAANAVSGIASNIVYNIASVIPQNNNAQPAKRQQQNNVQQTVAGKGGRIDCLSGSYLGSSFELKPNEEIVFGRDPSMAHIVLPEDNGRISRKHCGIVYDIANNKYGVIDYSKHGTFLEDGTRVKADQFMWVNSGTVIYFVDKNNSFKLV